MACVPGKRRQEKVNKQIEAAFQEVLNQGADLSNLLVGADPKVLDFDLARLGYQAVISYKRHR